MRNTVNISIESDCAGVIGHEEIRNTGLGIRNLILIWSKATDVTNTDVYVCWKVTNPEAEEMKDMVAHWDEFIVLSADGKPLGTAREYFLTK